MTSENPAPTGVDLRQSVSRSVSRLQAAMFGEHGPRAQADAQGTLARLRRSAGLSPEADPLGFQRVLDQLDPPLRLEDQGRGEYASPTERAAFHAISLFALHMQSQSRPMHVPQRSFATAVGQLLEHTSSKSTKPRFDALLAARSNAARLQHLRSLIALLRAYHLGFDYGWFAHDLRTLSGAQHPQVLLRWGRDIIVGPRREKITAADSSTLA